MTVVSAAEPPAHSLVLSLFWGNIGVVKGWYFDQWHKMDVCGLKCKQLWRSSKTKETKRKAAGRFLHCVETRVVLRQWNKVPGELSCKLILQSFSILPSFKGFFRPKGLKNRHHEPSRIKQPLTGRIKRRKHTHIRVGLEQSGCGTRADLVTFQPNNPFTNVHVWVKWTLCNYYITPKKKTINITTYFGTTQHVYCRWCVVSCFQTKTTSVFKDCL